MPRAELRSAIFVVLCRCTRYNEATWADHPRKPPFSAPFTVALHRPGSRFDNSGRAIGVRRRASARSVTIPSTPTRDEAHHRVGFVHRPHMHLHTVRWAARMRPGRDAQASLTFRDLQGVEARRARREQPPGVDERAPPTTSARSWRRGQRWPGRMPRPRCGAVRHERGPAPLVREAGEQHTSAVRGASTARRAPAAPAPPSRRGSESCLGGAHPAPARA